MACLYICTGEIPTGGSCSLVEHRFIGTLNMHLLSDLLSFPTITSTATMRPNKSCYHFPALLIFKPFWSMGFFIMSIQFSLSLPSTKKLIPCSYILVINELGLHPFQKPRQTSHLCMKEDLLHRNKRRWA